MTAKVVVIDHRDSFVFILGEQFARTGAEVVTVRCDVDVGDFQPWCDEQAPDLVVLSPGPGRPEEARLTLPWLATDPEVPVLGVCLGHQALALSAGGALARLSEPVHGRADQVVGCAGPPTSNPLARVLVEAVQGGMRAARYHSLHVTDPGEHQQVVAVSTDDEPVVMALAHRTRPRLGLQFHPESILSPQGGRLAARLLEAAVSYAVVAR